MNRALAQRQAASLLDDDRTYGALDRNYRKNRAQDHTAGIDALAGAFRYEDCRAEYWHPEEYSLLYGTPLWDGASASQRLTLNHLYWVAYYSQIISAEIATILLNQTAAAGLNTLEDFRLVCDTLDLETSQERSHIHAFKTVGEAVEAELFGERLFTYPMRSMFTETMIFAHTNRAKTFWKRLQLHAFTLLSAGNAFIGCQYFTIRGLRTLNGKIVQHALAQPCLRRPDPDMMPVPARISWLHFLDESYHFNSSRLIGHDVLRSLPPPTRFERWVANRALAGCQRDHFHFSVAIKGIFWHDPALFAVIYRLLRSGVFGFDHREALVMMRRCFAEESDGLHAAHRVHTQAAESYRAFVAPLDYVSPDNRRMRIMSGSTLPRYLATTRTALERFAVTTWGAPTRPPTPPNARTGPGGAVAVLDRAVAGRPA